ncbi:MAG TPA: M28 family peptidase, partial [Bacteroidia bacterium]|nr:M28 family peptidase [Bacteroidia bacterium]
SISLITGKKTASEWTTFYKKKIERAYKKGAKTLLIVSDNFDRDMESYKTKSPYIKLEKGKTEIPVFYISKSMADGILKSTTIDKLKQKLDKEAHPGPKKIKCNIVINIQNIPEKVISENVLGYIEGSDLKDELIVISAHYDHLGKDGNKIFNGADDDGSGTSAVLNIAKVFALAKKEGHGPRRSILCITFSGEEKGLLGSDYYVEHPEYPLSSTVCDLNIDMIGRIDEKHEGNPNYIYVIGSDKLSSELHKINETMNNTYCHLTLDYTYNDPGDKNRYYYRSDHYNFAKNDIPVIFYFNGVHADYHKETDEVEKIDFKKMEKITRLVFFTAWELANKDKRIKVDSNKK